MKTVRFLLVPVMYCLSLLVVQAQPALNRIEYFVDTDPGFGAAASVPFSGSMQVSDLAVDVPMASIPAGFHRLFIRARNANNVWGVAAHYPFYKDAVSGMPDLSRIEYFIDTDPGAGFATNIPFPAGPTVGNVDFTIPLDNVSVGFHSLFVRAQSVEGRWGIVSRRPFFKDEINQPDLVRIEYFIDTDPGPGAAVSVPFSRTTSIANLSYTVDLTGLSNGAHRLYVRAQNAPGRWSTVAVRDFTVQDNVILITGAPVSWCRNVAFNVGYQATGKYNAGNAFTLQLSDATGGFLNNVTNLATITSSTQLTGTFSATVPNSIVLGTGYRLRVISTNPAVTNSPLAEFSVTGTCICTTVASVRPGVWTDAGCWSCNQVPLRTDAVQLNHVIDVPVNTTIEARSIWYNRGSRLNYGINSRLRLGQ